MTDKLSEYGLESYKFGLVTSQKYWGKPVVIFNSASLCMYTKQFSEFEEIYNSNLITPIALPTNEFGQQDPGDNYEIEQYACKKYNVSFPICLKTDLNHTLFQRHGKPDWNFNKYFFDKNHNFVKKFDSFFNPKDLLNHV